MFPLSFLFCFHSYFLGTPAFKFGSSSFAHDFWHLKLYLHIFASGMEAKCGNEWRVSWGRGLGMIFFSVTNKKKHILHIVEQVIVPITRQKEMSIVFVRSIFNAYMFVLFHCEHRRRRTHECGLMRT